MNFHLNADITLAWMKIENLQKNVIGLGKWKENLMQRGTDDVKAWGRVFNKFDLYVAI